MFVEGHHLEYCLSSTTLKITKTTVAMDFEFMACPGSIP